jgi:hypothetical protein
VETVSFGASAAQGGSDIHVSRLAPAMETVGEHPVPAGPLAVRWIAYELEPVQAGAPTGARVALENAGLAAWDGLKLSYHWLDPLGNAILWDGIRTDLGAVEPGARTELAVALRGPIPPGRYRLAFDLVVEHRYWLAELGNQPLELEVEVRRRDAGGAVAHLPEAAEPAPDWHERVLAAHEEGYTAVGGSVEGLAGYPAGGRNPAFSEPLACPSLLPPLEPNCEVAGLPAWRPEGDEPWIYDGRIVLRIARGSR